MFYALSGSFIFLALAIMVGVVGYRRMNRPKCPHCGLSVDQDLSQCPYCHAHMHS